MNPTPTPASPAPTQEQKDAYSKWWKGPGLYGAAALREFVLTCLPPAIPEPGQTGKPESDALSLVVNLSDHESLDEAMAFRHFRARAADIVRAKVPTPPAIPEPQSRKATFAEAMEWAHSPPAPPTQASGGGWRDECHIDRATDGTYFVDAPDRKTTLRTDGSWKPWPWMGDMYYPTESAARAALAAAPPPPGVVTTTAPAKADGGITDADVEAVEAEVGMGCGAWDMINPKRIIAAARLRFTPAPSPPVGKVVIDRADVAVSIDYLIRAGQHTLADRFSAAIAEAEAKTAESGVKP